MADLAWHNERRKVGDLVAWDINPRTISESQREHLKASLEKFDLADPIIINTDNTVVGGHQRLAVLAALGRTDEEIDVRVPNRPLTKEEFEELALRLNRNHGEWDWQKLEEFFDIDTLLGHGFEAFEFGLHNAELPFVAIDGEDTVDDEEREEVRFMASNGDKTQVTFECVMTKANRDRLIAAINKAKADLALETTEEALLALAHHFLEVPA